MKIELPNGSIIYTPFPHYEEELRLLPPTVSLAANGQNALSIPPNTTFTLAWSSSGAQSCTASGSWSGSKAINGSQNISGFASGSRTYTLTCQNAAGSTAATVTVSVTPLPTVNLTANGQSSLVLPPDSSFTLAWSSSGAQSCTASGAPQWSGSKPTSGSQLMTVLQLFGSQTYTLTCSNSSGSTSRSVIVTIGEAPPPCEGLFCIESLGNGATGLNAPEGGGPTQLIQRSAYQVAGQTIATRVSGDPVNNGLTYFYNDHLGSLSALRNPSGGRSASIYYLPFGNYRGAAPTQTVTDRDFTGQPQNDYIKLIDMRARWYDPAIGRFISPDPIIPDPANPQSLNRYSYVYNNPVRYTDSSGHCIDGITTWVCIAAGIAVVTKVIDYGITAWDTYQAGRTLADPTASGSAKMMAGLTVGLSILFEAIEPDDILPIGLPADDVARRAILNGAEEVLEKSGPEALEGFLRNQLGDHADDVLAKLDELLGIDNVRFHEDPGQLQHIFRDKTGHLLEDTVENRKLLLDTVSHNNFMEVDQHGNQVFARVLDDGTEVWVQIRDGIIQNGGLNQIPTWIKN